MGNSLVPCKWKHSFLGVDQGLHHKKLAGPRRLEKGCNDSEALSVAASGQRAPGRLNTPSFVFLLSLKLGREEGGGGDNYDNKESNEKE